MCPISRVSTNVTVSYHIQSVQKSWFNIRFFLLANWAGAMAYLCPKWQPLRIFCQNVRGRILTGKIKCSFLQRISRFSFEKRLNTGQENCTVVTFFWRIWRKSFPRLKTVDLQLIPRCNLRRHNSNKCKFCNLRTCAFSSNEANNNFQSQIQWKASKLN